MTSKSVQEARFIAAPDAKAPSDSETEGPLLAEFYEHRRREATVYDAVAGNVTTTDALPKDSFSSRSHRRRGPGTSGRDPVLAPEEVLFQRRGAPQRYAERDVYFANERDLGPGGDALPDSDLLKAVHAYASDFYEAVAVRSGGGGGGDHDNSSFFVGSRHVDERSMDETALLAFGILLEEAGREALGRRGDLVFTEGVTLLHHHHHHHHGDGDSVAQGGGHERGTDAGEQQREEGQGEDDDEQDYEGRRATRRRGRGLRGAAAVLVGGGGSSSREVSVGLEGDDFWRRRLPKRRKVAEDRDG